MSLHGQRDRVGDDGLEPPLLAVLLQIGLAAGGTMSTSRTRPPSAIRRSTRWPPIKPGPPVTCFMRKEQQGPALKLDYRNVFDRD
jgi:hypothetical protein